MTAQFTLASGATGQIRASMWSRTLSFVRCGNRLLAVVAGAGLVRPGTAAADHLPYHDPALPVATRVADLLSRMSLDEKLGQMTQLHGHQYLITTRRSAGHLWLGEVVATAGLILLIFALTRSGRAAAAPAAVGAYIGAAYWFTSSTSFANPAVTIGRAFTDTFAGIAPASTPAVCRRPVRRRTEHHQQDQKGDKRRPRP